MSLKNPPKYCHLLREYGLDSTRWPYEYFELAGSGTGQFSDIKEDALRHTIETAWGQLLFRSDSDSGCLCRTISVQFNAAKAVPAHASLWSAAVLRRLREPRMAPPVSCPASPTVSAGQDCAGSTVADFQFWGDGEKMQDAFSDFCDWIEEGWLEFIHAQVGLVIGKSTNHITHEMDGGELAYVDPYSGGVVEWCDMQVIDAVEDAQQMFFLQR